MKGEAKVILKAIRNFEFIFILFLMNKIMRITDALCQTLQPQTQNILNTLQLV